ARREAALDLVLKTRPRAILEIVFGAVSQQKMFLDDVEGFPRGDRRGIWPEIAAAVLDNLSRGRNARPRMAHVDLDAQVALVVFKPDVVARLVLLDQVVFQDQRFFFVAREQRLD